MPSLSSMCNRERDSVNAGFLKKGADTIETKTDRTLAAEQKILTLSFIANILFVVVEILFALVSHSQSVLMDAANDTIEMVVIVFTLFLTPLFHQPISEKRPFGYAQVETVFTAAKALMMLSVMLGLGINVVQTILSGGSDVDYPSVSLFQFLLGVISLVILIVMYRTNRSISSPTVRAELLGWRLDAAYSMGLALAFFLAQLLKNTRLGWLSPYFDQIGALIVVALVLPEGVRLLRESVRDIFLFSPGEEHALQIKEAAAPILAQFALHPVFYDITQTGRRTWVSIYFDSAEDTLYVSSLRQATDELQKKLCSLIENCSCELILAPRQETGSKTKTPDQ